MLYCYVSHRPLFAPSSSDPHRRVEGPVVFKASKTFGSKCKHPKLFPYSRIDKYKGMLKDGVYEELKAQALTLKEDVINDDTPYREIQRLCLDAGVNAKGSREELVTRFKMQVSDE